MTEVFSDWDWAEESVSESRAIGDNGIGSETGGGGGGCIIAM